MMHQCEKIILSQLPAAASDSLHTLYEELYGTMALPLPLDSIRHRSTPLMVSIWQHLGINEDTYRENLTDSIRRRKTRQLTGQAISPEIASIIQYDPSHDLSRVQCPVWAVNGAKDLQVLPKENLKAIETLAKGSPQVVTHIYPGLNHLFMPSPTAPSRRFCTSTSSPRPWIPGDRGYRPLDSGPRGADDIIPERGAQA